MKKRLFVIAGLCVIGLCACGVVLAMMSGSDDATPAPTYTRRVMYFCGYDRCRNSGAYGEPIMMTGINVWNGPDPNRGGVHHQAKHGDQAVVIGEQRVGAHAGQLWYKLEGGGWANDLWLTDEVCSPDNLEKHSLDDC